LPRPLSLSSTCACSSSCLLRVPMRCVLELCALVLGVWCTCAAFAQIVRRPLVNVVDIAGVHRAVLCAGAACLRCRTCVPHARVACTCCACDWCARLRYARLHFPCSRCVYLLCLPSLCVPALCALVRCVVCLCSAHIHRVELADPASPSTLATCHELYPFPILSHICLLLSCIVPPSLPHFLLMLFLLSTPYFTAYFVLFPACGCASERWHRSRCPQLNTPATLFPTHSLRVLLPLYLLCFPAALLSFLCKKENEAAVAWWPHLAWPIS
jgi:hypothetical protein